MPRTGLVYHTDYLKHDPGEHPEVRERLGAILDSLEKFGLLAELEHLTPRRATEEEVALVHDPAYIEKISRMAVSGGGMLDEDTVVSPATYEVAMLAVGGVLTAVEKVMTGEVDNAFALVRPPGHHAARGRGMGFCIFNNIAVGASFLLQRYGLERILIVDWDAHHGDGLQSIFYEEPRVLYFSVHQEGIFPYKGWINEIGTGPGEGYNINVPVPKGTSDAGMYYIFTQLLEPVVERYKPQFIFIACGTDAHFYDYLSNLEITAAGFGRMTRHVMDMARTFCQGRVVAALEGGYNLESLGTSVAAVINEMGSFGRDIQDSILPPPNIMRPQVRLRIDEAIQFQRRIWKF